MLPLVLPALDISAQEYDRLRQTVLDAAGIALGEGKRSLVIARLRQRVRALGLHDFTAYCDYLARQDADGAERQRLLNCITTNQTDFFREPHHFEFLQRELVPAWRARAERGGSRRLRVWSAGCSTGEEPYSVAMTLLEALGEPLRWDLRILATDIDTDVLDTARTGIYPRERIAAVTPEQQRRFFLRGRGAWDGSVRVRPVLQSLVTFRQLNLVAPRWPMTKPFDLILCRNVVIYFDRTAQRDVCARLAGQLAADGHLLIGHSESLTDLHDVVQTVAPTIYRPVPR